jgi:hypothetical protein
MNCVMDAEAKEKASSCALKAKAMDTGFPAIKLAGGTLGDAATGLGSQVVPSATGRTRASGDGSGLTGGALGDVPSGGVRAGDHFVGRTAGEHFAGRTGWRGRHGRSVWRRSGGVMSSG